MTTPREIGKVEAIYRYPVKSMAGQPLDSAAVGWHGIEGDRRFAFNRAGSESGFPWLSASKLPKLLQYRPVNGGSNEASPFPTHVRTPEGKEFELRGEPLQQEISDAYSSQVKLVHLDQGIFDEAKVSLIASSTIDAIGEETGTRLDVARFRPNILIEAIDKTAFGEDEWVGKIAWIGDGAKRVALYVYMKDVRCVMINLDPATGTADHRVMKAVVRMNENNAGVYAMVMRTGLISVGEKIYLQEIG
jgi:uncharacterized protein YcbX